MQNNTKKPYIALQAIADADAEVRNDFNAACTDADAAKNSYILDEIYADIADNEIEVVNDAACYSYGGEAGSNVLRFFKVDVQMYKGKDGTMYIREENEEAFF